MIYKFFQTKSRVEIWLYDNTELRIEGRIIGFDEYMNCVLDEPGDSTYLMGGDARVILRRGRRGARQRRQDGRLGRAARTLR